MSDELRLADIAEQIAFIDAELAAKDLDAFIADRVLNKAVAFALQIIGEAANNLSLDVRARAVEVPWGKIVALRNRIAHGYFSLDLTEIWRIATVDVPQLREQLIRAGLLRQP